MMILGAMPYVMAEPSDFIATEFEDQEFITTKNNVEDESWYSIQMERDDAYLDSLNLTSEEFEYLSSNPIIKIGLRLNNEPYSFVDNSKYKGYYKDLLENLFRGTGVKIAYLPFKVNQASVMTKVNNNSLQ
jgi:hypothetical protein